MHVVSPSVISNSFLSFKARGLKLCRKLLIQMPKKLLTKFLKFVWGLWYEAMQSRQGVCPDLWSKP